ncbi:lipoprotein-releasing ABC transporter permease subunit [Syntrophobacter fumaroxidans]|uniref:Lipoprotein releasing system, transmembrane protein, LolC/E family n=1 Tax=Syntrophobacter fumaroxidans (strain DSM 10017 / MPOB) TaxID=335543 RepID=A0LPR1_SYNFM|nr:lipoprotein-releasing ABC transporter permease subunit [Syntrophobacter fumaroxidans]ABK19413.1 lipoprotein releasing system, transmembrane protein, LolC/E family [Syntrophobacter fumaroxidans MPOB]
MNFELFVSLRYLFAKRRQTFISLITLISIAGVAVGVTALIVVLAVMNGFQEDLRNRILGVTSHVVVGSLTGAMNNYPDVIAKVEKEPGVVAAAPFVYSQVMLTSGRGISGAILRGIDPLSASKVIRLQENMIGNLADLSSPRGDADAPPAIILGSELAGNLGVRTGDWVTMISPTGRLTPMGQTPKSKLFQVVGMLQSGMYEYDNTLVYVDLPAAQQFLGIGDTVTGVEIRLQDIYEAAKVSESLRERLGAPYWARDWMQMNRSLFSALKLEKVVMFVILTLIILVAAFNIVSSLIMLVMEKGRDIAILKAMGATTASIRKIFVLEGLMIGVSGTILGLLGGFGLCGILERYKFIDLPPGIYHISKLPVKIEGSDVAFIALAAIMISLIATLYPSRQAAKLDPAEALRYE